MGLQTFDEHEAWASVLDIGNGAGTGQFAIAAFRSAGGRIDSMLLSNTGLADRKVRVIVTIGATSINLAEIDVPAGSGVGGVPPVDGFAVGFPAGVQSLLVPNGMSVTMGVTVTMLAATFLEILLIGGSF